MQEEILITISRQLNEIIHMFEGHSPEKSTRQRGRPTKEYIVMRYREYKPNATKIQCMRETKLDIKTVNKYWDLHVEEKEA